MSTTRGDIQRMWEQGQAKGATHMIIVCDTFDYEDYPVYVRADQDVHAVAVEHCGACSLGACKDGNRLMEVYNFNLTFERQVNEVRAFHP